MARTGESLERLEAILVALRDPEGGCPWDLEQTPTSLIPHTIEEAYEVAEAIDSNDVDAMEDELGDLLLQVVYQAQFGRESGQFTLESIAERVSNKMVRRHPHVFGEAVVASVSEQNGVWDRIKTEERKAKSGAVSALDDIPHALPALARLQKIQRRAASVGFDWPTIDGPRAKLHEELAELEAAIADGDPREIADELGDVIFSAVNLARKLNLDCETLARAAGSKFEGRFRAMEIAATTNGHSLDELDLNALEVQWQAAKNGNE
ncbi:nucleoside triphosphate pyrophosphohydrolase [Gammaproteobacteria bacterium]|nr:nucleoside triphosphate pyrophosphohydrolase [Gammaproteobacteria bacterium]